MSNSFGPWTIAMTMSSPQRLSTFWKRRLTMLLPVSRISPKLSRGAVLALTATGVLACLLPTLRLAPVQAQAEKAQADAKAKGRIFVSTLLRYKPEGKDVEATANMIIAVDPVTGKWQKITDQGFDCRVSPDRQTLVFSRLNEGIWNCDTQGSNNPGKISDKSGRPIWSPDGKHLVATKQELLPNEGNKPRTAPAWKDETWRIDASGGNPVKLPIPDTDGVDDWSPDGQWFLTCSDRHPPFGRGYQLYLMKTDGTEQKRLTQGGLNCYGRFSPDGRKVLYTRQTAKAGNSIWVVDVDGKNAKEIVKEVDLACPDGASWSPDGKQLAVHFFNWELDENGKKISRGPEDGNHRIEIMDADGQNRRALQLVDAKFVFIGSLADWR